MEADLAAIGPQQPLKAVLRNDARSGVPVGNVIGRTRLGEPADHDGIRPRHAHLGEDAVVVVIAVDGRKTNAVNERLAKHVWAHRDDLFTFLRQPGLEALLQNSGK